jgi:hypothetical protein
MRRRLITAALLALILATGGCEFDLTEVHDPSLTKAHLSLQLAVREHRGPLQVTAWFHPGTDDQGRTREVSRNGTRSYRISGLDAAAPPRRLWLPRVAGIDEAPPEVLIEPLRVQAPDTLMTARTGTLELRLAGMGNVQQPSDVWFWSFRVYPSACAEREILSMAGTTAPPSVLRVPVDLVPSELKKGAIQYQGSVRHVFTSASGSYAVQVDRSFAACIPLMVSD